MFISDKESTTTASCEVSNWNPKTYLTTNYLINELIKFTHGVVEIFQETGHFVLYLGFGFFHFSTFSKVFNSRERVLYLGSQQQKGSFGSQPDLHLPPYLFGNFSPFASLFVPFACFFF